MSDVETTHQAPIGTLSKIRKTLKPISVVVFSGAQILDIVNVTGLILSTSHIAEMYDIPLDEASWSLSAYVLTFGSFILLSGRFADYVGHRFAFMLGMGIVAVCCLITATVKDPYVLFVFRALQGVGASLTVPTSFALIAHSFTGRGKAIAMACVGAAAAVGGIVGVILGGVFQQTPLEYRALMFFSFGLACLFFFLVFFVTEETPKYGNRSWKALDFVGAAILVCATILVVFAFSSAPGRWSSARFIAPLIIGLFLYAAFVFYLRWNYTHPRGGDFEPLIPARVFRFTNFRYYCLSFLFNYAYFYAYLYMVTQQFVILRRNSPIHSAVQVIPAGVCFLLGCIFGGVLFGKVDVRTMLCVPPIFSIPAIALMTQSGATESYWKWMFPAQVLLSFGVGVMMPQVVNGISFSAPMKDQGMANGVSQTIAQVGVAIAFAIATSELDTGLKASQYHTVYYTMFAYAGIALVVVLFAKPIKYDVNVQAEDEDDVAVQIEEKHDDEEKDIGVTAAAEGGLSQSASLDTNL